MILLQCMSTINHLKMLGLYFDTFIIAHKCCSMLSKLNYMNKFCKRNCTISCQIICFGPKSKNTTTTKQKSKHKNPNQSRESNPGNLEPKSNAKLKSPFRCFVRVIYSNRKNDIFCVYYVSFSLDNDNPILLN